jgi:PPM family protein phosphatase
MSRRRTHGPASRTRSFRPEKKIGAGLTALTTWAAGSVTGRVREANEDSAYAGRWLYAVADGLGGHVAGDVASAAAVAALAACDTETRPARLAEALAIAVTDANNAIRRRAETSPEFQGMGTTLTAMLWSGRIYALAHIGDSRAYRLRGSQLRQLTEDHTLGNLVAAAKTSPLAPVMSRHLDGRADRSPDLAVHEAVPGDRYLLCTDGLSGEVPDHAIRDVLDSENQLTRIVERLISLANSAGGSDNITAIVIDLPTSPALKGTPAAPETLGAARENARVTAARPRGRGRNKHNEG